MDLQEAFDAGFEAVKAYVDDALGAFEARLKELEGRPAPAAEVPAAHIRQVVAEAVAALPQAVDGKDGKDGVGLAGAVQSKDGHLVLTLTNGATVDVGSIVGRDGKDGEKGADGRDGADGLGFDDLEVMHDGERSFTFRFSRGAQVKEFAFTLPVVLDRGVWSDGKAGGYAKGDAVTWAGSVWISQKDGNTDKPDGGEGWRLAVKRGRDGKPGRDGEVKARQPVRVA